MQSAAFSLAIADAAVVRFCVLVVSISVVFANRVGLPAKAHRRLPLLKMLNGYGAPSRDVEPLPCS
jgi:hypothetical protein